MLLQHLLAQRLGHWQKVADDGYVRWAEAFTHSLQLTSTPLNVAEIFRKQMGGHPRAWIFTSATLAVQGKFHHYCAELGLGDPDSACWHSPFDYDNQAILYAPLGMPDPNAWNYTDAVVDAAWPAVKAANGGAFFLCTSLRAMRRTHELLKAKLEEENIDMPLLVQGEGSKNDLLQRFRHHGNSILVGSQSFWEGVDVKGDALSLLIIARLPFAVPTDPIYRARSEQYDRPFDQYALPGAIRDGFLAPIRARRIKLDVDLDKVKTRAGETVLTAASIAATSAGSLVTKKRFFAAWWNSTTGAGSWVRRSSNSSPRRVIRPRSWVITFDFDSSMFGSESLGSGTVITIDLSVRLISRSSVVKPFRSTNASTLPW